MIRGFGASKTGMAVEQARTDVLANNLANMNTTGFKKSVAVSAEFESMLLQRMGDSASGQAPAVGFLGNGSVLSQVVQLDQQGQLMITDQPLDFAIEGPGQFIAEGPNGVVYTRNGAFRQTGDGTLVTAEGYPVVIRNQAGELGTFQAPGAAVEVRADGTLLADGQVMGRLELQGAGPETRIHGRALEGSNVELGKEMTDLTIALRSYQVNQRAMQMQDQTLAKAVTEIAKL